MPHLLPWTGRKVAEEAVEVFRRRPDRFEANPRGAVEYLKAHGINGAVIGRVLSGGQVREDDRAMVAQNDIPSARRA